MTKTRRSPRSSITGGLPSLDFGRAKRPSNIYEWYDEHGFAMMMLRLNEGDRPSGEDLARVIEANPDEPLPPALRDYLCRYLRHKIGERGRKKVRHSSLELLLAGTLYNMDFKEPSKHQLAGADSLLEELPAHLKVLERIRRMLPAFAHISARRLYNMLSERRMLSSERDAVRRAAPRGQSRRRNPM